ncbi:hypothetical protein [Novosphingobium sp. M1R2S20]|uniref:Uncharacterized protein n=1 Tax=Novosphingobium rhizovicinum TaxID=3228928 RepID=A0ABV3RF64_9SPHN
MNRPDAYVAMEWNEKPTAVVRTSGQWALHSSRARGAGVAGVS